MSQQRQHTKCNVKGCHCVGSFLVKRMFGNSIIEEVICNKHYVEFNGSCDESIQLSHF